MWTSLFPCAAALVRLGDELDVWRAGIRPVISLFPLCLSLDLGVKGEEGGK